jgi:DNA mismatch repair protein MutL
VIDRIAAGEVIERPASVVKELVENALDAGARMIAVDVDAGGRRLVRVVDDGCGMSPADARRALARHATSKLRDVDDLWTLGTMGFRGEALPSIASVSRMVVTTRRRGDLAATRIEIDGGRVVGVSEAGAAIGTCVEVEDLLHNVPARLKFLKGEATEASHITEAVQRLAMAHPHVHFRLKQGGRTVIDAPPCVGDDAGLERARMLVGVRMAERLHPVVGEDGGIRVTAYLGAPELAQTTARGVQIFVGRRFVRDRALLHAVTMGYGELVPRGRYPIAIVAIEVPGATVDINVHPQKMEVRFSDASAVAAAVRHVIRRGVATAPWLGEAPGTSPLQMLAVATRAPDLAPRYAASTTRALFPNGGLAREPVQRWISQVRAGVTLSQVPAVPDPVPDPEARSLEPGAFFSRLRYLGQLDKTYLICEGDGEMVLIDQHAAHERVEFQRLREKSGGDVPVQRLLFPQNLEVTEAQVAVVEQFGAVLAAVGFEVEPFGRTTIAVKAMPAGLRHDPAVVLSELLGDLADRGGSRAVEERLDHVLATIACHSVVRAGDHLGAREVEALLAQMDGVDFRAHCPHGRPALLRIGVPEIARRFGR